MTPGAEVPVAPVEERRRGGGGSWERTAGLPCIPLFHRFQPPQPSPPSLPHAGLTNDELRRKANSRGYVLPENSYQYRCGEGGHGQVPRRLLPHQHPRQQLLAEALPAPGQVAAHEPGTAPRPPATSSPKFLRQRGEEGGGEARLERRRSSNLSIRWWVEGGRATSGGWTWSSSRRWRSGGARTARCPAWPPGPRRPTPTPPRWPQPPSPPLLLPKMPHTSHTVQMLRHSLSCHC